MGVACPSAAACFAVGVAFDGNAFVGHPNSVGSITERWDGSSWSIQTTPTAKTAGTVLNAISCSSPSACTAVGATNGVPVAERWDGGSWTVEAVPAPVTPQAVLYGVSCTSAVSCLAVGAGGDNFKPTSFTFLGTLAERWDGATWQIQPTPASQGAGYALGGVACTSGTACTAVGLTNTNLLAERWDGAAWTTQPLVQPAPAPAGNHNYLGGVSCPSLNACTAVGVKYLSNGPYTIAEQWNGSTWSNQTMPPLNLATDILSPAVSCLSATTCTTAAGLANAAAPYTTLIEQYGTLPCIVPNLKGKTLHSAARAIRTAQCALGRVTKHYSSAIKAGRVISQNPKPRLTEPAGSKIALVVSRGRKP
jgi:hypothetical protein